MREINRALSDILEIRARIAAGTAFRGYGPLAILITGGVGLVTATLQNFWPPATPTLFVIEWLAAADFSAIVVRIEMQGRTQRLHSGLADVMIDQAMEQFLPATAASLFLPFFLLQFAPQSVWMMPGFWQIFVSLGIFASVRTLPRLMMLAGAWYFLSGCICLMLVNQTHMLSPWLMGLPFLGGQILMAGILYFSAGDTDDEN